MLANSVAVNNNNDVSSNLIIYKQTTTPLSLTVQTIMSPSGVSMVVVSANTVAVINNNDISNNLIITLLLIVLTYIPEHHDAQHS